MRARLFSFILFPISVMSAQTPLGIFEGQTDVGRVSRPGSVLHDPATQRYTIAGSGANMWMENDDFHFVWKHLSWTEQARLKDYVAATRDTVRQRCPQEAVSLSAGQHLYSFFTGYIAQEEL